jgi:hypothetical protein
MRMVGGCALQDESRCDAQCSAVPRMVAAQLIDAELSRDSAAPSTSSHDRPCWGAATRDTSSKQRFAPRATR